MTAHQNLARTLRMMNLFFLASIVMLALVMYQSTRNKVERESPVFLPITLMAVLDGALVLGIKKKMTDVAEEALRTNLEDVKMLEKLRTGYLIQFAFAESVALFGLVLRFLGMSLLGASLFFIAAILLLLYSRPSEPVG